MDYPRLRDKYALLAFTLVAYSTAFALDYLIVLPLLWGDTSILRRILRRSLLVAVLAVRMWTPALGVMVASRNSRSYLDRIKRDIKELSLKDVVLTALVVNGGYLFSVIIATVLFRIPLVPCIPGISIGLLALLVITGLVAGVTINGLVAIGEELAWRGFLLDTLSAKIGTWKALLVIGIMWGLWHAPLIANGYNFSNGILSQCGGSVKGLIAIIVFTLFTISFGAVLSLLRLATGNIYVAAVGHGIANAVAGLYAVLLNGSRIIAPPAGISASLAFAVTALALSTFARREVVRTEAKGSCRKFAT